jgi:putative ABC transport system permease protein
MALGANGTQVIEAVMLDGLRPVASGVVIGLGGALALSRIFSSLLFNVPANDPSTFLLAALLLTLVAIAACLGPARKATRVDPTVALRAE